MTPIMAHHCHFNTLLILYVTDGQTDTHWTNRVYWKCRPGKI